MSYPKPGEKTTASNLSYSASLLGREFAQCQSLAEQARKAFEFAQTAESDQAIAALRSLTKAAARQQGIDLPPGHGLDGPAWVKLDQACKGKLGLSSEASSQSLERAESRAALADYESKSPSEAKALEEAAAEDAKLCKLAATAYGLRKAAKSAVEPHETILNEFFAQPGATMTSVDAEFSKPSGVGKFFGTAHAKKCKRWADAKVLGADFPALQKAFVSAREQCREIDASLAEVRKRVKEHTEFLERRGPLTKAAARPRHLLDAGGSLSPRELFEKLQSSSATESALVAISALVPAARSEARACMKHSLSSQALGLVAAGLGKEAQSLAENRTNMTAISEKMSAAAKRSSSPKASVSFDMREISSNLTKRCIELADLSYHGPAKALAKIDAIDWNAKATALGAAEAEELRIKTVKTLGADSAPAKAFAQSKNSQSAGGSTSAVYTTSDDTLMSTMFWHQMLYSNSSTSTSYNASSASFDFSSTASSGSWDAGSSDSSWDSSSSKSSSSSSSSYSTCSSSSCSSGPSSSCSSSSSSCSSSSCSSSSCSSCSS